MRISQPVIVAAAICALALPGGQATGAGVSTPNAGSPGAVIGVRVVGHSVDGRAIRAYHLGDPGADTTAVALAAMHGNETDPRVTLRVLRHAKRIRGLDLWLVPNANPDGVAAGDRHNAHGVDLNRNFPKRWVPLTGIYYSGPRPASEPETRALMRLLNRVNPDYVVSFHQPLYGIDTYKVKDPAFARRLARFLYLPRKVFSCGGVCHGTLTQWFNATHRGALTTVEYNDDPSWRYLHVVSPSGLLRALGGHR